MNKIILIFTIILFLVGGLNEAIAQKNIVLKGKVNKNPNVNIVLNETRYGTTSDEEGAYSLSVFTSIDTLQLHFSKIGYQDTIVQVIIQPFIHDTVIINISLKELSYQLIEVNITSFPDFYRIRGGIIIDIAFLYDHIFLLITKREYSELEILNMHGDLLLRNEFDVKYEAFYKDCFMNLGVIGESEGLQFYYNTVDTTFSIIEKFTKKTFDEKLRPCLLKFDCMVLLKDLFYEKDNTYVNNYHNKKVNFFYINICSPEKKQKLLISFFDKNAYMISSSYYQEILNLYNMITPDQSNLLKNGIWNGNLLKLYSPTFDQKLLKYSIKLYNLISWYLDVESTPINVVVFKKKKELVFINQLDNILKYTLDLESVDTVLLNKQNQSLKISSIMQDEMTEDIYACFIKNGIYKLGKINTSNGFISDPIKSNNHPFPAVIKVYNNFSYSIYNSINTKTSRIERKSLIK